MRKAKKTSPVTLKASSLSELRDLQRQASRQADNTHTGQTAQPSHGTSAEGVTSAAPRRRRPHRFLPPSPGPVTATLGLAQSATESTPDGKPDTQARQASRNMARPTSGSKRKTSSVQANDATPPALHRQATQTTPDPPKNQLDNSDVALFRRVVQSVTPAAKSNRVLLPPTPPATPKQLQQRREHAMGQRITPALNVSDHYASVGIDHDDTVFLQTGQGPHLIKGLKKGKWQVQASLDLHGSTLDHARERMDRFIQSCREHQIRCVRIVHGKGYGSKNGDPVLKETVRRWLSQLAVVQAYIECDEADGGAGAVLVLLSKNPDL